MTNSEKTNKLILDIQIGKYKDNYNEAQKAEIIKFINLAYYVGCTDTEERLRTTQNRGNV